MSKKPGPHSGKGVSGTRGQERKACIFNLGWSGIRIRVESGILERELTQVKGLRRQLRLGNEGFKLIENKQEQGALFSLFANLLHFHTITDIECPRLQGIIKKLKGFSDDSLLRRPQLRPRSPRKGVVRVGVRFR